MNGSKIE